MPFGVGANRQVAAAQRRLAGQGHAKRELAAQGMGGWTADLFGGNADFIVE